MLHIVPSRSRLSDELKETVTDLEKHPSRRKRVRETNRVKMTGLNRGSSNTIRQCQTAIKTKTERAMTPWAIFVAIDLTEKKLYWGSQQGH